MSTYCDNCRATVPVGARFCNACGADVSGDAPRLGKRSHLAEEDETIIWSGSFSPKGLIHSWLLAGLISIVLPVGASWVGASKTEWLVILSVVALVWIGLALFLFIQRLNVHYELTNHRLIHRSGILVRRTNRIELIDMSDVSHEQGLIERFFDVGTIEITSSDHSHPVIELYGINDVDGVAMLIDDARLRERSRRGVHIEQI